MSKKFDEWNKKKQLLNIKKDRVFYHSREIWWCALGVNIGSEQDGTGDLFDRPVVVIKDFNQNMFFGVPLTGQRKETKYHFYLGIIDGQENSAILSQVRLIDTKRLIHKIQTLDQAVFDKLKEALKIALF